MKNSKAFAQSLRGIFKKRSFVLSLALVVSLMLVVRATGAWLSVTGNVILTEFTPSTPPAAEALPIEGGENIPTEDPTEWLFCGSSPIMDSWRYFNSSRYPVILRGTITEVVEYYSDVSSDGGEVPSGWLPTRVSNVNDYIGEDWVQLPHERISFGDSSDPVPENLCVKYKAKSDLSGFDFFVYAEVDFTVIEESGYSLYEGKESDVQKVDCDRVDYYKTDALTVYDVQLYGVRFQYHVDKGNQNTIKKVQWVELAKNAGDSTWITQRPTLEGLVDDWDAEILHGPLRPDYPHSVNWIYRNLAKAPTSKKWFYNENDGYFYYIGLLESGATCWGVLEGPIVDEQVAQGYWMRLELNEVGEVLEANKDAASAMWGLTFEPGSLGAKIFGDE